MKRVLIIKLAAPDRSIMYTDGCKFTTEVCKGLTVITKRLVGWWMVVCPEAQEKEKKCAVCMSEAGKREGQRFKLESLDLPQILHPDLFTPLIQPNT